MTLTDAMVRSRIREIEDDFQLSCETGCDLPAQWMVWARHNVNCQMVTVLNCENCMQEAEDMWNQVLSAGELCKCGLMHTGDLSDNFRALPL